MLDSVSLTWGHAVGTAERRARGQAEPLSAPVRLDLDLLGRKLGNRDGQITAKQWGDGGPARYGHWQNGAVDVMYREGRLELRASLPKLLLGRNDVVLDERGVHDALRELVHVGRELVDGCESAGHAAPALSLREADPARLDYCFQWTVPSVGFYLETLKSAFKPARKNRSEHVSPKGGRTMAWGSGSKRMIRFYDKVGELISHKEDVPEGAELDTLLRYEIQERRRPHIRLVHEDGYRAAAVRRELEHGLEALRGIAMRDLDAILASYGESKHAMALALSALYLVEHDEAWPWVRKNVSQAGYYRWRKRVAAAAMSVGDLNLEIPPAAFETGGCLWALAEVA